MNGDPPAAALWLMGLVAGGLACLLIWSSRFRSPNEGKRKLFRKVATELGLSLYKGMAFRPDLVVSGHLEGLYVSITDRKLLAHAAPSYRIEISDPSRQLSKDLTLTPRDPLFPKDPLQLRTGDPEFDAVFDVRGGPEAESLLSDPIRRTLLELLPMGPLEMRDGTIVWTLDELDRFAGLKDPVDRLVALGKLMTLASVRDPDEALDVARGFLQSDSPHVRFQAARYLGGPDGLAVLRSLALDPVLGEDLRRSSLIEFTSRAPRADSQDLLKELLQKSGAGSKLEGAAVELIGRLGLKEVLPLLLDRMANAPDETVVPIAHALEALGAAEAEKLLLLRMQVAGPPALAAILRALGSLGSTSAIEALTSIRDDRGASMDLRRAAREAIERVRSRLTGAAEGQLSITDLPNESGALSLPDAQGALSEPVAPRPRTGKVAETGSRE